MIKIERLKLSSKKQFELIDITDQVSAIVKTSGVAEGLVTVFSPHTTASIRLNHNEPLLIQDIMKTLYRIAPLDISYAHDLFEIRSGVGVPDRSNGHAHVKSFLLGSCQAIPVANNNMLLGKRQSIFFVEFDGGREREAIVTVTGE